MEIKDLDLKQTRVVHGYKVDDVIGFLKKKKKKITRWTYVNKENGKTKLYVDEAGILAELYKCDIADIFKAELLTLKRAKK